MAGRKHSTLQVVGGIYGITVAFELLILLMGGEAGKIVVRFLLLSALFALLLKGYRWPRYVLGLLYLAGGLFALFAGLSNLSSAVMLAAMLPFAVFSLVAAWFFFRSPGLRAWAEAGQA